VARKPDGAEAVGAHRRLRDVSGDRQGSLVLAEERKDRPLALIREKL
jgi:hypothetical protein